MKINTKKFFELFLHLNYIAKVLIIFCLLFLIHLFTSYGYLRLTTLNQINNHLNEIIEKVISDLRFENNIWDTTFYVADTNLPYDTPLYIVTSEGFIIDRIKQINGFLDTSSIDFVSSFTEPQTYKSTVNEVWRIYSKPIIRNNKKLGSILVADFEPYLEVTEEIDSALMNNADYIDSKIKFNDGVIDISGLDIKEIGFDISYEVVDIYNQVLISDGGAPAYVDRSFVAKELAIKKPHFVRDNITGIEYLIQSKPITDNNKTVIGVVVAGQSLELTNLILKNSAIFSIISGAVIIIIICTLGTYVLRKEISLLIQKKSKDLLKDTIERTKPNLDKIVQISFDLKDCCIIIDKNIIKIKYASYQYYLCKAIFLKPNKRWENDELAEIAGEGINENVKRTFYDAAEAINKRVSAIVGESIILYEDKTFRLNPSFLSKLHKSNG